MSNDKSKNEYHHLLIIPKLESKSKKYYHLFKPKEIVVLQPFEFCFKIKNKGNIKFPGGVIEKPTIQFSKTAQRFLDKISIPEISKDETYTSPKDNAIAIESDTAWFHLNVKSSDNKPINYYQLNKITNEEELLEKEVKKWQDCFHIASEQEMHQRYTNYLLLGLTIITIFLFIINVALLLR